MNRMTLARFCKEHNLSKDDVCLEVILGRERDVLKNYNDLKKFYTIRDTAKQNGKSLSDVLDCLSRV